MKVNNPRASVEKLKSKAHKVDDESKLEISLFPWIISDWLLSERLKIFEKKS